MFRIGEFARFTRVSVKMLRHYDEIGLLPPAYVDPRTGYRWYATAQLPALNRILLLRELGFGLGQIAADLDGHAVDLDEAYERRERELLEELAGTTARLRAVRSRRQMLADSAALTDVVVRPVAAELVATLGIDGDVSSAFYRLEDWVRRQSARAPRPPMTLLGADGAVTVAVPLTRRLPDDGDVSVTELAAEPAMACTVHRGRYDDLPGHLQRMLGWLEQTGREPAGCVREVYLRFGAEPELRLPPLYLTDDAEELVTELQVPVRPATD